MNSEDKKPTEVLNELKGIKDLLDDDSQINEIDIPILDEVIPELNESIPTLDEQIEIIPNIKVTLDSDNSTETVEQQLIRTHYEQQPDKPQLVVEPEPATSDIVSVSDKIEDTKDTVNNIDSVDFNIQDQLQQFEQGVPAGHPQNHQKVIVQNELAMDDDTDILQNSPDTDELSSNTLNELEDVIEKSWEKVEMLLMENLPTQLSGAYLELINSHINDNKQRLIDELSLLDEASFLELLEALNIDEGF